MRGMLLTAVADRGSTDRCDGDDWVEMANTGGTDTALAGYVLHDDKGPDDSKAFTFGAAITIAAGETLVLCKGAADSFEFKIGGDDTVTLLDASRGPVDTSGQLGDAGALNLVWTRTGAAWGYEVVGTLAPTPSPTAEPPVLPVLQLTAVADKGSTDRCDGEDWVAFSNTGTTDIALAGYTLHDANGPLDDKAFTFAAGATIAAGQSMALCKDADGSFEFGIGGDDTVTLLDANDGVIDSTGQLGDQGALNYVWTRTGSGGWEYQVLGTLAPTTSPIAMEPTVAPNDDGVVVHRMDVYLSAASGTCMPAAGFGIPRKPRDQPIAITNLQTAVTTACLRGPA